MRTSVVGPDIHSGIGASEPGVPAGAISRISWRYNQADMGSRIQVFNQRSIKSVILLNFKILIPF